MVSLSQEQQEGLDRCEALKYIFNDRVDWRGGKNSIGWTSYETGAVVQAKEEMFFIFNILYDSMERRQKTLLQHKEEKQLFDLQAELAAIFTAFFTWKSSWQILAFGRHFLKKGSKWFCHFKGKQLTACVANDEDTILENF